MVTVEPAENSAGLFITNVVASESEAISNLAFLQEIIYKSVNLDNSLRYNPAS